MNRRLSVSFINHGPSGSGAMGHASVEGAFRIVFAGTGGTDGTADIDAEFVSLPPWRLHERLAGADWPPLNRWDLDLQALRWHLVEGHRARKVVKGLLRVRPPDLLHVTSHTAAFRLAGLPIPFIVNVDATVDQWESLSGPGRTHSPRGLAMSRRLERRTFESAAAVVAMSQWSADGVRRVLPNADVRVIHPGIDVDLYGPDSQPEAGPVRVLFVGARFREKGGPELLRAVQPLLGSGVVVDIVTPDTQADTADVRWHRLRPADPQLRRLFGQSDVLCLPTFRDAVPWVVIEAFASGTPVIGSDVGALPEFIGSDSARGMVVAKGDQPALRRALQDVPENRDAWVERGREALTYARAGFDVKAQAEELAGLVREVR